MQKLATYLGTLLLLSFLHLSLVFSGEGDPISLDLPAFESQEDKLALLIEIKKRVPQLFSEAALYKIDLTGLLEDERVLLDLLKSNPEYLAEFKKKKFYNFTITPPPSGLLLTSGTIKASAIADWKETLQKGIREMKASYPNQTPDLATSAEIKN